MDALHRRRFATALMALLLSTRASGEQPPRPRRLAWLSVWAAQDPEVKEFTGHLVGALRSKGWILGENYLIEFRFAAGDPNRFGPLAEELIAWHPDVIYCLETAARVVVTKTRTIPIVLATSSDAVGAGLVKSLARPGTNVTGMAGQTAELAAKQIGLLAELVPQARRFALVLDPTWAAVPLARQYARAAARLKGLVLVDVVVSDEDGVRDAFRAFNKQRVEAVMILTTGNKGIMAQLHQAALRARLPTMGFVAHGAILEYTQDGAEQFRESADFIDQVFRGANPADLPIRQPNRFLLSVNQPAAREAGVKVPQSILMRADRVIE